MIWQCLGLRSFSLSPLIFIGGGGNARLTIASLVVIVLNSLMFDLGIQ